MKRFIDPNDNFRQRPPLSPERVAILNAWLSERHADYNKRFQETWDETNAHWKAINDPNYVPPNQDHTDFINPSH